MPSFIDIMKFIFGGSANNDDAARELREYKAEVDNYKQRMVYIFIGAGLVCILILVTVLHACE